MKRNLIIGGIALALFLISIKFFPYHCNCQARGVPATAATSTTATSTPKVVIDGRTLSVDVADTEALREQGLSGRTSLGPDSAMLFIFPSAEKPGFWMKDMNFSLDIVWIGPDKKILGVEKDLAPSTYPQVYFPSAPVGYVLEMPAGSFDTHSLQIGDAVSINL
jgi:uncharacterized membrane protein (UPF0127 family)